MQSVVDVGKLNDGRVGSSKDVFDEALPNFPRRAIWMSESGTRRVMTLGGVLGWHSPRHEDRLYLTMKKINFQARIDNVQNMDPLLQ